MDLLLADTYKRIEKSLNIRFEADSSLYISKEDEEKVKRALSYGHEKNLSALAKNLGNKIVAAVILKNSWLVQQSSIKTCKKIMVEILGSLDQSFVLDIAGNIVNDNVYSSIEFKRFIEKYYFDCIPIAECRKLYRNNSKKIEIRAQCFARYIYDYYISEQSGEKTAKTISYELNKYADIKNYLNRVSQILPDALSEIDDKSGLVEWIINNTLFNPDERYWESILLSFKEVALESGCQYITNNPYYEDKKTKYLIQKIFPRLSICCGFEDKVISLFKENIGVRIYFIHMIQPSKFKDKILAQKILESFENIGVNPNWERHIAIIKEWQIGGVVFIKAKDVVDYIDTQRSDMENVRVLSFYTSKIRNKQALIKELYDIYKDRIDIRDILSNYFANSLKFGKKDDLESISLTQDYIDKISFFLEKDHINNTHAQDFLAKHQKFGILEKLNRR